MRKRPVHGALFYCIFSIHNALTTKTRGSREEHQARESLLYAFQYGHRSGDLRQALPYSALCELRALCGNHLISHKAHKEARRRLKHYTGHRSGDLRQWATFVSCMLRTALEGQPVCSKQSMFFPDCPSGATSLCGLQKPGLLTPNNRKWDTGRENSARKSPWHQAVVVEGDWSRHARSSETESRTMSWGTGQETRASGQTCAS
jgi:hypothetical protein